MKVTEQKMIASLGKTENNDLHLPVGSVSGSHARIGYDPANGFFICEQAKKSTNGTFIAMNTKDRFVMKEISHLVKV